MRRIRIPRTEPLQNLAVSPSGYFSWIKRLASLRQRKDMIVLAHIRSTFRASREAYGSACMTLELRERGLAVGRRRTARLMRENAMIARQKRRFKRTTDSNHFLLVAKNIIDQDLAAKGLIKNGGPIFPMFGRRKSGSI